MQGEALLNIPEEGITRPLEPWTRVVHTVTFCCGSYLFNKQGCYLGYIYEAMLALQDY